ncbi:MAG: hypothetical protein VX112_01015 [Pseudomonadota bacterium]|nr:hypothetical protein [Pseudomonadota bacterium]
MLKNKKNELPKPLELNPLEKDNLKRGGKIFEITLAAGNGHLEMARRIKDSLHKRYPEHIPADSFLDPVKGARDHPGVWLWNIWQKNEYIGLLKFLVSTQSFSDWLHHYASRVGLCQYLIKQKAMKVIDTQTNSTISTAQAVGDYNLFLAGKMEEIDDWIVKMIHVFLDPVLAPILWKNPQESWYRKTGTVIATFFGYPIFWLVLFPLSMIVNSLYRNNDFLLHQMGMTETSFFKKVLVALFVLFPLSPILVPLDLGYRLTKFIYSFFVSPGNSRIDDVKVKGPVRLIKVLTDVPVYDASNRDNSTINYFDSLNKVCPEHIKRSHLEIVSPPLASIPRVKMRNMSADYTSDSSALQNDLFNKMYHYCQNFFSNPLNDQFLQSRVTYTTPENALVRDGFKIDENNLPEEFGDDTDKRSYSKSKNRLNVSVMLGGNGGPSLVSYTKALKKYLEALNKAYPHLKDNNMEVVVTLFCGRSFSDIESEIKEIQRSAPENFLINPLGFIRNDQEIAAVLRQADLHITRPGGISIFELDTMNASHNLLFHTPLEEDGRPSLEGLVSWERSNPLWLLMRRRAYLRSPGAFKAFCEDHLEDTEGKHKEKGFFDFFKFRKSSKGSVCKKILERSLQDHLVTNTSLTDSKAFLGLIQKYVNSNGGNGIGGRLDFDDLTMGALQETQDAPKQEKPAVLPSATIRLPKNILTHSVKPPSRVPTGLQAPKRRK